jgi:O-antigen/teichoic acid export membrane protein
MQTVSRFRVRRSITFLQYLSRSTHMRQGLWYLGSNMAAAFIPFLLLPFLTRTLDPTAYGTYSLFTLVIAGALPLVNWMFSTIIAREYGLRDENRFATFFTVCLCITLALTAFWGITAQLLRYPLDRLLHIPPFWIQCGILCALAQGLSSTMQSLYAMRKQPIHYSYWRLGYALAMGAALYLGATYGQGWESLGAAQTIVATGVVCFVFITTARHGWLRRIPWNKPARTDAALAIRYSTPLVIHILTAGFLLQSVDRLFVSHYLGLAEAGSYNVAQQISLTMALLVTSMNQVWQPWINEQLREGTPEAKAKLVRTTYFSFAGLWGAGLLAIGFLWVIFPHLIGAEFHNARHIMPILMVAGIISGMYVLVAAPLFFYGNTMYIMYCNIGTALISVLMNLLLVPRFGMEGAAFATLIATTFMFVSVWITGIRLHSFPWFSCALKHTGEKQG